MVAIQLDNCSNRPAFAPFKDVALFDICLERCLTMNVDSDQQVVKFLRLSPYKDNHVLLATVYEIMAFVYEFVHPCLTFAHPFCSTTHATTPPLIPPTQQACAVH